MTTSPISSATGSTAPAADPAAVVGAQGAAADMVLAGRAVSSGQWIAGLIAAAQLDTVGKPRKLPADLFPDMDPGSVQEVWDRALAVGVRAGQLMSAPRFNRDKLSRLQAELLDAGHAAMGRMVGRSVRLVDPTAGEGLAADGESARGHGPV